ncbi:uncharacterized protein LOC129752094 [Uranotaenia lowii]|uniref:uncharacterized protein LOC129752094 n=1 Tax=Uranotaenia lowii TaxID=190385 RepID=UPI0024784CA0|nr:uncharacterized protein LOC129752094 [Uranotaenia lowii]
MAKNRPTVQIKPGKIIGSKGTLPNGASWYCYKGIPYAEPPIGKLRFRPPVPLECFRTPVLDCSMEGNVSLSNSYMPADCVGSEDCLFLNVYTPVAPEETINNLPVMIWIHGGAFCIGSGNSSLYNPEFLVQEGVVVVTFNYRLGPLGFLCLPSMEIYGNMGLKDQRLVLKWVHDNIRRFGGDRSNVTIFGESAGAASVHIHCMSEGSRRYFRRAICQSGVATSSMVFQQEAEVKARRLAQHLGCRGNTDPEIYEFLYHMPAEDIAAKQKGSLTEHEQSLDSLYPFKPVIEAPESPDPILSENVIDILSDPDRLTPISMILGVNSEEAAYKAMSILNNLERYRKEPVRFLPDSLQVPEDLQQLTVQRILKFYCDSTEPSEEKVHDLTRIFSDNFYVIPALMALELHVTFQRSSIYFYRFTMEDQLNKYRQLWKVPDELRGACHADDLCYLFSSSHFFTRTVKSGSRADLLRGTMCKLWTNFAKTGNPTPDGSGFGFTWEPCCSPDEIGKCLQLDGDVRMVENHFQDRLEFWRKLYTKFNGSFLQPNLGNELTSQRVQIRGNPSNSSNTDVKIQLKQGKIIGTTDSVPRVPLMYRFSGIRYAKAPIGELRFKPPVPLEKFQNVPLDCRNERHVCPSPQYQPPEDEATASEDCLFLNVYMPKLPTSGKLLPNDVVAATFNYRLGPLGLAYLPSKGIYGNMGLKDQHTLQSAPPAKLISNIFKIIPDDEKRAGMFSSFTPVVERSDAVDPFIKEDFFKATKGYLTGNIPLITGVTSSEALLAAYNIMRAIQSTVMSSEIMVHPSISTFSSFERALNKHRKEFHAPESLLGVCHGGDLQNVFEKTYMGTDAKPGSNEYRFRTKFCKLWTNFAKQGNPTPPNGGFCPTDPFSAQIFSSTKLLFSPLLAKRISDRCNAYFFHFHQQTQRNFGGHVQGQPVYPPRENVEIQLKMGKIIGTTDSLQNGAPMYRFSGIPYAKPPIGELRFKPPVPLDRFQNASLDCRYERHVCPSPQYQPPEDEATASENCLFLNVYTPKLSTGGNLLPVMVFIHGGGFIAGSGNKAVLNPKYLVQNNVVAVTFNYRLGPLGFAYLPSKGIYGNMGLKDQRLVLRWVKENIKSFGGNPGSVTLFGESAGAASVHLHYISDASRKYFHKAICMSGVSLNPWVLPRNMKDKTRQLAKLIDAHATDDQKVKDVLKSASFKKMIFNQFKVMTDDEKRTSMFSPFTPVVEPSDADDPFIQKDFFKALKGHLTGNIPLMLGVTTSEAMLKANDILTAIKNNSMDSQQLVPIELGLSGDRLKEAGNAIRKHFLPTGITSDQLSKVVSIFTDNLFRNGAYVASELMARYHPDVSQYFYVFKFEGALNKWRKVFQAPESLPGVCHGDDLQNMFGNTHLGTYARSESREDLFRKKFCKLWTNFAKHGNPTPADGGINFVWKTAGTIQIGKFNMRSAELNEQLKMAGNPFVKNINFWRGLYEKFNHDLLGGK